MTSTKKTLTIPSAMGSNAISDSFGKITFSNEVRELLSAIEANIVVSYHSDAAAPTIELLSKTGNKVCSLDEFKKLSQYRRFVNEVVADVKKKESNDKLTNMVGYFIREARRHGSAIPARILEQNYTKFNQFGSALKIIEGHVDNVDGTVDNEWKRYAISNLGKITRIIFSAQLECMKSDPVDKGYIDTELRIAGVPKWVYNKFLDKNFTNNLKVDCLTLFFPKNNYLKSFAMTTSELQDEAFLTANQLALSKSGGIIALAKSDFSNLFPSYESSMDEAVADFCDHYQWVLTNPYTADDILSLRETGKMPPVFKEVQPSSKRSGTNSRSETELGKICRQIANVLGRIQSTWNGILNFVIPVADPKIDFWAQVFSNHENWAISPTNSLYKCIRAEGSLAPLDTIRNASSTLVLNRIAAITATVCDIPHGSEHYQIFENAFLAIKDKQAFREMDVFTDETATNHPIADLTGIETSPVTQDEIIVAKSFLGVKDKEDKAVTKRSGTASVRAHTCVLKELLPLKVHPKIYSKVLTWITSSFKTGNRELLQKVAAERVLGEAFKAQDTIFGEVDLANLVGEIEEQEDDLY